MRRKRAMFKLWVGMGGVSVPDADTTCACPRVFFMFYPSEMVQS